MTGQSSSGRPKLRAMRVFEVHRLGEESEYRLTESNGTVVGTFPDEDMAYKIGKFLEGDSRQQCCECGKTIQGLGRSVEGRRETRLTEDERYEKGYPYPAGSFLCSTCLRNLGDPPASREIWIQEDYNEVRDSGDGDGESLVRISLGESEVYRTSYRNRGDLFRALQERHGLCISKVYIDTEKGPREIGWVFKKRAPYEDDESKTYVQEVWVTTHVGPPKKTIRYYLLFGDKK